MLARGYSNRAITYGGKGGFGKEAEYNSQAMTVDPREAEAYSRSELSYNKLLYDKAIEDYSRVITTNPKAAWAYINRGITYSSKGE